MPDQTAPLVDAADAIAISHGAHGDPFAVLGPHMAGRSRVVRAFDPGAERLWAVVGGKAHPLDPVPHAHGVFAGKVPGTKPYRLRGEGHGGSWEAEDPYRFGPVMGEMDEYLLGEGTHRRIWQVLGAHVRDHEGTPGTHFAVWAPSARRVSVVGDFNHWDGRRGVMRRRGATGVWEIFWPHVGDGARYKFEIIGHDGMAQPLKADPVGFGAQHPPETASIVRDIRGYGWKDADWMATRAGRNARTAPISVYEVHLGSWRRRYGEGGRPLSYREAAHELVDYAHDMGFTHIELLPISEFPFDGSWGYQPVGLFAPTIRFGPPHEFRDLVDAAHAQGDRRDPRLGAGPLPVRPPRARPLRRHGALRARRPARGLPQRLEHLHLQLRPVRGRQLPRLERALLARGIPHRRPARRCRRLHALPRLLRKEGEWVPNKDGGRENYEAIALLQRMNVTTYGEVPGIMTVAEESTSFPKVSAPVDAGGLGFGYKWNMGWMNDTLDYMKKDPIHRRIITTR
jgi:1,4-alpha-glucan branching enzyme